MPAFDERFKRHLKGLEDSVGVNRLETPSLEDYITALCVIRCIPLLSSGLYLIFTAFPRAVALIPFSSLFAVVFFLMMILIFLDNQVLCAKHHTQCFAPVLELQKKKKSWSFLVLSLQVLCLESVVTAFVDLFPHRFRKAKARRILALVICAVCFQLGLPYTTGVSSRNSPSACLHYKTAPPLLTP